MNTAANNSYQIDLPVYSGPLDLLMNLIEQNELDITSISLLAVTDQYLAYVGNLNESKIEHLLNFLVIGARLLLIKSRALLPHQDASLPLEDIEDPAEMLARQLRDYRRYKEAGSWLQDRRARGFRTYLRIVPTQHLEYHVDLNGVTTASLLFATREALNRAKLLEDSLSSGNREHQITIEGQIKKLQQQLDQGSLTSFSKLLSEKTSTFRKS